MPLPRRAFLGGLLALAAIGCAGEAPAPVVGRPAPDFELGSIDGERISLAGLRGRPVVVNFFATWCKPCKQELPAFQAQAARHVDNELTFLLVDMQEDPDDVAVFLGELGVSLPAVVDSSGEVGKTYRVRGLPSTFFVGRDGVIKQAQLGELDGRALESGISKIV
jgi:cytochrome c biogenesis protein CcmG/thiol:disulfide interchange protein DsbE